MLFRQKLIPSPKAFKLKTYKGTDFNKNYLLYLNGITY